MKLISKQAIGIFDSGVGGLTVASSIKYILPNENIIYFGDTAHLPYGDKSSESIKYYSKKIADFLLGNNCKIILIACNTASASAYKELKEYVDNKAVVINVIDPVVQHVIQNVKSLKVGVIGTKGTINSGTYEKKIKELNSKMVIKSLPTPLFVPMIEEGFIYDDISNAIIRSYLSKDNLKNIDTLILGCTHYPVIKNQIRKFYDFRVNIIDSSRIVANFVKKILHENNLVNTKTNPDYSFYVSDYTETFEKISEMFFEHKIHLKKMDLWK